MFLPEKNTIASQEQILLYRFVSEVAPKNGMSSFLDSELLLFTLVNGVEVLYWE